ncbi:transcription factor bHLH34-like [Silene latifolia]|uniref:transcription factor bHLH34-like n=1 Tax=Silene latifolia TaxID=37657 RepID=UPI003D77C62D
MMGSFDDNFLDEILDCNFINDVISPDFSLIHGSGNYIDFSQEYPKQQCPKQSYSIGMDFSQTGSAGDEREFEKQCLKRKRIDTCSNLKTKACRERERRELLNTSFSALSSILEPGRAAKTDKLAIVNDAIRVVKQLRTEAEEYREENKKLESEIQSLKAEKNELREEKLALKSEKEKMELQLKTMPVVPSPGLIPSYHVGASKMELYPSYGMYPMWHYLPPSTRDTSHDHELRPPAA